jgi:hypothetical protein
MGAAVIGAIGPLKFDEFAPREIGEECPKAGKTHSRTEVVKDLKNGVPF